MFRNKHVQVRFVKDSAGNLTEVEDNFTEKVVFISEATIRVMNEASKVGVKLLVTYIALDTWRKIAVAAATK